MPLSEFIGIQLTDEDVISPGETLDNPFPTFDDADDRLAYAPIEADVHRIWLQIDDHSLWALAGHSPVVWTKVTADGSGHDRAHSLTNPLDHSDVLGEPVQQDGYVLAWSATESKWVPTDIVAILSAGLITETGESIYDDDGQLVMAVI